MMLAYAVLGGFEHIEIYGVDMAVDDFEYYWQRPCMEAWIGFARGRGLNVVLPSSSPVGKNDYVEGRMSGGRPEFGLPPFTEDAFSQMVERHELSKSEIDNEIRTLQAKWQGHDGASQGFKQMSRVARAVEAGQKVDNLMDTTRLRDVK